MQQRIANREQDTLLVELDDIAQVCAAVLMRMTLTREAQECAGCTRGSWARSVDPWERKALRGPVL